MWEGCPRGLTVTLRGCRSWTLPVGMPQGSLQCWGPSSSRWRGHPGTLCQRGKNDPAQRCGRSFISPPCTRAAPDPQAPRSGRRAGDMAGGLPQAAMCRPGDTGAPGPGLSLGNPSRGAAPPAQGLVGSGAAPPPPGGVVVAPPLRPADPQPRVARGSLLPVPPPRWRAAHSLRSNACTVLRQGTSRGRPSAPRQRRVRQARSRAAARGTASAAGLRARAPPMPLGPTRG